MEMTMAVPGSLNSNARLKGRARGALICGVFGAVFMIQSAFFGTIVNPAWLAAIALSAATFIVWPVTEVRSRRHLEYSPADRQRWAAVSTVFWTDCAIEWLACTAACIWLANIRRYDLIPHFLGGTIGLHFLPLAKVFKMPLYYWTGTAMVLGAWATLAIPAGHVHNFAAYGANGLSLWATAAVILCQDRLSSR